MSTILNCDESFLICSLRLLEGSLALVAALAFIKAYLLITKDKALNFSAEDKLIFLLELGQLAVLGAYYLLFQEFFLLATVRSLMIWSSICLFQYMCSNYYEDPDTKNYLSWGCLLLRLLNFLLWFYVAIVDGTTIENKNFNVGYNCLVMDWVGLSAFFTFTSSLVCYVTMMYRQKLQFLKNQSTQDAREFYEIQINSLLLFAVVNLLSPLILFLWDFFAFVNSRAESDCVDFFSGNSVLTSLICFVLKVVGLQGPAYVVYECVYKRREGKMVLSILPENNLELLLDKRSEVASNSSGSRYSSA